MAEIHRYSLVCPTCGNYPGKNKIGILKTYCNKACRDKDYKKTGRLMAYASLDKRKLLIDNLDAKNYTKNR